MLSSWRLVKARHAATAFDGEGARRLGGRWNSPGTAVVYTAESISLAVLEVLVHVESPELLFAYSVIECSFDERLVEVLADSLVPKDWQALPIPAATQSIGDRWVSEQRSVILAVPSVIVPTELNFVFNPAHRDFAAIKLASPRPFTFDQRLLRRAR